LRLAEQLAAVAPSLARKTGVVGEGRQLVKKIER